MEGEDVALTYCLISDLRCLFAERSFQMAPWKKTKNKTKKNCMHAVVKATRRLILSYYFPIVCRLLLLGLGQMKLSTRGLSFALENTKFCLLIYFLI